MRGGRFFKGLWRDSGGGTAIEYGLVVSLIVIAVMAAIVGVGEETGKLWSRVQEKSAKAIGGT